MLKIVMTFAILVVAGTQANPAAKPGLVAPVAYTAPLVVSSPIVTATSSQFIARNYNGFAAPIVAAPVYTDSAYSPYYAVNSVTPLKYRAVVPAPVKYTSAAVLF